MTQSKAYHIDRLIEDQKSSKIMYYEFLRLSMSKNMLSISSIPLPKI